MEEVRIPSVSNWKMIIKRTDCGVIVLRAVSCDKNAVLPDELFGLPVVDIADRALSPTAKPLDGEKVTLSCGLAEGEFDNRGIQSLTLPRNLRTLRAYALMNLSSMHTVEIYDNIEDLNFSAFMNCRLLRNIILHREREEQGSAMADIISRFAHELYVTVHEANGERLELVFPEYLETYDENGPTHFFDYVIEGTGYAYHHVFNNRSFSVLDYDKLWKTFISMDYDRLTALRMASGRLLYPYALSSEARCDYESYIYSHARDALDYSIKKRDVSLLRLVLQSPTLSAEDFSFALALSREKLFTEATAMLLEKQHGRESRGRRKTFDL